MFIPRILVILKWSGLVNQRYYYPGQTPTEVNRFKQLKRQNSNCDIFWAIFNITLHNNCIYWFSLWNLLSKLFIEFNILYSSRDLNRNRNVWRTSNSRYKFSYIHIIYPIIFTRFLKDIIMQHMNRFNRNLLTCSQRHQQLEINM